MVYDARTGLPLKNTASSQSVSPAARPAPAATRPRPTAQAHHSHDMHRPAERSQTLNRRVVRQHAPKPSAKATAVTKSPAITKFAPHPSGIAQRPRARVMSDIGPTVHPTVKKVHEKMLTKQQAPVVRPAAPKPSRVIKKEVVEKALHEAPSHAAAHKPVRSEANKPRRALSIASASLALLLLGGYFTYLNMPSLSVRVAAAQAGINASYPSYHPDGYGRGVVGYQNGEVSVKFASTAGPQNFVLTQEKTTWDSTALKENFVDANWGDNIDIVTEHGLTIYRKDGNAAWVNGGILYTISGDAPLSPTQIRNIAASM